MDVWKIYGFVTNINIFMHSWNEQASGRKLPYSDAQKTKRPVTNGTVKCQCGAKVNGLIDNRQTDKRTDSVQLKSNSRVGSKYLQALASNTETRRYIKRDSSVGEKSERRNLYSARSRSIENFHNQHYLSTEPLLSKAAVIEESSIKHHTSYGDLYNGRISSKESVNGNRYSPNLNGQSTDTDYSSDGGYKSLPSSINYNISPKKVSGIPRRSIEQRFISPKHVRASAIWTKFYLWHSGIWHREVNCRPIVSIRNDELVKFCYNYFHLNINIIHIKWKVYQLMIIKFESTYISYEQVRYSFNIWMHIDA